MANTKTIALEAAVKAAADMSVLAQPGYGQSNWMSARASLPVAMASVASAWAKLQGQMVARAEMRTEAARLVEEELAARRAVLRDYRAAAEAARLAAALVAQARPAHRKAIPQAAASAPARRKAIPQAAATLKTAAKAAATSKAARPAMDLEALVAAGFARQAAAAAKKAGATPAAVKAVRKAAKKEAQAAAKAQKVAKKAAQAAFKAAAAGKAAAKAKGRKA